MDKYNSIEEKEFKETWVKLQVAVNAMLLSGDEVDKPYVHFGRNKTYTRYELAQEVMNGTPDGIKTMEMLINLTIDLVGRGKKSLLNNDNNEVKSKNNE